MINIFDVASYFLSKVDIDAGETITHLKLQKLVYYAQAWHLTIENERLFDEHFEAWAHGPVSPTLFQEYRSYGFSPIPYPEDFDENLISEENREFLDDIWNLYGKYDAKHLEKLTHREPPWLKARGRLPEGARCDTEIDEKIMIDYYGSLLEDE